MHGSSPLARGLPSRAARTSSTLGGSSPLARGLPVCRMVVTVRVRIIPARAGFTGRFRQRRRRTWDHPRSRGVYRSPRGHARRAAGSSPLARGLLSHHVYPALAGRIIPARAGFTSTWASVAIIQADHPRSRGVYVRALRNQMRSRGSSPLARGLHMAFDAQHKACRIIPARAGFTCPGPAAGASRRDHPRSRGVYPRRQRGGFRA